MRSRSYRASSKNWVLWLTLNRFTSLQRGTTIQAHCFRFIDPNVYRIKASVRRKLAFHGDWIALFKVAGLQLLHPVKVCGFLDYIELYSVAVLRFKKEEFLF